MDTEETSTTPTEGERPTIDYLNDILPFIDDGAVIPIISNSFRLEEIFREDTGLQEELKRVPEFYDEVRTIDQQLTKKWAEKIKYPMSDDHNLARVAQYRQVESEDPELAKMEYLKFINDRLLTNNEKEKGYEEVVGQLRKSPRLIFSDVVRQLDYPRFPQNVEDPLRLLARLPLPIYITTSYFNFLERALEAEDKKPRTQICFWNGSRSTVKAEHLPDRDYVPSATNPAVYHLFGLENYAKTLVLSEDDYMTFLMDAVEEINTQDLFPSPLRGALPDSRLLLIGYHLRDWDFRTLFRFIMKIRKPASVPPSIALQLKPNLGKKDYEERSLKYLEQYFKDHKFKVKWMGTEKFIYELWEAWDAYKRGQS